MTTPNCLFCKIGTGELPGRVVWRNEKIFVLLNLYPSDKGHVLFIPHNHAEQLDYGDRADSEALMGAMHTLTPPILKALGATGYNIGVNSGVDAGQEIFHTHIHFIPRYAGKPREFGKQTVPAEELDAVATTLTDALKSYVA